MPNQSYSNNQHWQTEFFILSAWESSFIEAFLEDERVPQKWSMIKKDRENTLI
jgi:hypothetical protein